MKKVSKKNYMIVRGRYEPVIIHMVQDFGLTVDECVSVLYNYGTRFRQEDFSHYLWRTTLQPKGFVFEEMRRA